MNATTVGRWITHLSLFAAMTLAPAAIAIGLATSAQAATPPTHHDSSFSAPAPRHTFPNQSNFPQPGTSIHHHHQHHG